MIKTPLSEEAGFIFIWGTGLGSNHHYNFTKGGTVYGDEKNDDDKESDQKAG